MRTNPGWWYVVSQKLSFKDKEFSKYGFPLVCLQHLEACNNAEPLTVESLTGAHGRQKQSL